MPESRPITYGRGGAGNVTSKPLSPALGPQTTPTLKSSVYTTGRGGTGNMAKNDNPEEARRAQDVDVPGVMLPEGSHHIGRGTHDTHAIVRHMADSCSLQAARATSISSVRRNSVRFEPTMRRCGLIRSTAMGPMIAATSAHADKAKDKAKDALPGNKQANK